MGDEEEERERERERERGEGERERGGREREKERGREKSDGKSRARARKGEDEEGSGESERERERERGGLEREPTGAEGVGSTLRRVLQTERTSSSRCDARTPPPHSRNSRRCPPALRSVWNTILLLADKEAVGASSKYRWPGANDPGGRRRDARPCHSRLL